ncbi:hypothetical protein Cst_c14350 [Thermoclostridium stercorarium subsp. stercorarium DSM 8532]|uniref:TadE-like domain-containing protein n=2 Tax=Thermoclostridium stercorarium TaxID=1510 RepID=L7VJX0_THES1|nr:TadE/TadG family type IV pilus assembly protein [Thermoclostridium stercorarium]AGC68425.1 hypothetical protein Cst_c14350 [Thermoclostridium stercorarium subsp. stercorarium DSM 8532]AGI39445.1 pilus protein [Thermoclostridium stercorarium subsp. stercorarium DSM 8532]ANW98797.1 hypothetical protein CSTERTH_07040 [Thermoclostridium stercorarium subsp. thermolacticum DSM 2910]
MKNESAAGYAEKQRGSATVEAAVVIPLLMIAFVSLLTVIRIISTYARMQHAVNKVATELAHYSYIYAVSGLKQQHDELLDTTKKAWEELQNKTAVIENFYKSVQNVYCEAVSLGKENKNIEESLNNFLSGIENIQTSTTELIETVNTVVKDPVHEMQLIGIALSDSILSKTKTVLFDAIVKAMLKNNLANDLKIAPEKLEKSLFLKGGIEKLDLSSSTFFNDRETIDIIVEYTVKPAFFIIPEVKLRNRACVLSWQWGVGSPTETAGEDASLWNLDKGKAVYLQHLARGNKIDRLFARELKNEIGEYAELTPENFKTIDLIEYAHDRKDGSLVMIFSLNPFLPTYSSKSAVVGTIKQNLNKLSTFQRYQVRDYILDVSLLSGNYKRIAYIVIPENEVLPEAYIQAFEECKKLADKMGIELYQVQKYGKYDYAEEN